ncbi:probable disease resistance protein RPP1 [Abrus precatorius]|uniref:Probable disease resistance protein RPP1 n=1 Tax=Abrus precatorius TaxID=3816 RepID=A0A8B8MMW9_ABRPR|nr:probable disease resistance protein RPP1 [Abrus precatorius]
MPNEAQSTSNYDVFLSFRDQDTRYSFTGTLYNALRRKRINTFFEDDGFDRHMSGNPISPSTLKAIENSRISIVVLSENYAFSSRCLDELVKILECMKTYGQLVFPIFYKLEPWDVKRQIGYAKDVLKERLGDYYHERVQLWSETLDEVVELNGWIFKTGYEYELIRKVVESAVQSLPRYDVFLSFTGEDTRYSFTGFLYNAFRREGFKIFMDDEGLEGGNQISLALIRAIEKSKLSIVVFSENYGYSTWCLDELAKIIECMKTKNQLVWPIFYKVEQSDVSNQTKSYGAAMGKHEEKFGKDSENVKKWRSALSEIANLKGHHRKENEYHYEFIERIVEMAIDAENH